MAPTITPLNDVIRVALAERGVTSLRDANSATGIDKNAILRRYRGEVAWTLPDIEKVAAFLDTTASELIARTERAA